MAILALQTLVGQIGRVYELRTVGKDNQEVIDFTVAVTPRKRVDGEWTDGDTYWMTVTAWGRLAKNISESFNSGDRVFVHGRTEMKAGYTNRDGKEMPPRPIMIAEFAGLEVGIHPAESNRPARGEKASSSSSSNSSKKERPAKKEEPVINEDDFDLDLDDDDSDFDPF